MNEPTAKQMLANMEGFDQLPISLLEEAINAIMIAMVKDHDDRRMVNFCNLDGEGFSSVALAEEAINRGEFCACVTEG